MQIHLVWWRTFESAAEFCANHNSLHVKETNVKRESAVLRRSLGTIVRSPLLSHLGPTAASISTSQKIPVDKLSPLADIRSRRRSSRRFIFHHVLVAPSFNDLTVALRSPPQECHISSWQPECQHFNIQTGVRRQLATSMRQRAERKISQVGEPKAKRNWMAVDRRSRRFVHPIWMSKQIYDRLYIYKRKMTPSRVTDKLWPLDSRCGDGAFTYRILKVYG